MTSNSPIPEPPMYPHDPTPPVTLVLTILLLVMFFVGFFSIYFCRCFMDNLVNSLNNRQTTPNGTPINPTPLPLGLDSSIVNSFPTFPYSSVKDYRREKYGLECAICLCEFDDNDILRLLTICCHVFHQDCIDLWFESHKSCPVCRGNLDTLDTKKSHEQLPNVDNVAVTSEVNSHANDLNEATIGTEPTGDDSISIVIRDDHNIRDEDNQERQHSDIEQGPSSGVTKRLKSPFINEKFSRSHSTGHSIFKNLPDDEHDKYTLRLPEHIRETITRRHIVTLSCTTFGEFSNNSTKKHDVFGEISGSSTTGGGDKKDVKQSIDDL